MTGLNLASFIRSFLSSSVVGEDSDLARAMQGFRAEVYQVRGTSIIQIGFLSD